jgi:hypothetical protein
LITAFYNNLDVQKMILSFMQKEFACKGELLQRIGEQAAAEGDENNRCFVQALTSWLDND